MLEIGAAISLFHDVVTGGSAIANIYKTVSGIIRGNKTEQYLKQVAEHVGDIRVNIERLSDNVLYASNLQAVRDVTQNQQRAVDDLREVRESLEPLSQTVGQEILSSAMIWTPDKMQKAMHKDPWDVLQYIRPLSHAGSVSYPDMVPVLFEDPDSHVQYVGWQKHGMLLPAFDCEYEDLWVPKQPEGVISSVIPKVQPTSLEEKISPAAPEKLEQLALPPVENIHGWSADKVQALQQRTAEILDLSLPFRDCLANGSEGPEMILIPPGRFLMGSPEDEEGRDYVGTLKKSRDNERQHPVTIRKPFAIGRYVVTFEEYDQFCQATGSRKPTDRSWGRGKRPVIYVSWYDAIAYAQWLSEQTSQQYGLPTEAQWEYAARAGTTTPFHFGQNITLALANYGGIQTMGKTMPVGQFPPNDWGLYDVHNNVSEWTCSIYRADYDGSEQRCVNTFTNTSPRTNRSGSWSSTGSNCRSARRTYNDPGKHFDSLGFRLTRVV